MGKTGSSAVYEGAGSAFTDRRVQNYARHRYTLTAEDAAGNFRGETHRLEAGGYTWYVWPGRGPRRLGRYGPLIGKSTFVVG